jgi:tetratricopeptide (TPR) repeat protein
MGGMTVFHQWIDTILQGLTEIEDQYPTGSAQERERLKERFHQIQTVCQHLLESWALVEEQMARLLQRHPELSVQDQVLEEEFWLREESVRQFRQGQGYYQLRMFAQAENAFNQVVKDEPEFLLGRIYLALSHFQSGEWDEADRQFQMVAKTATHDVFLGFAHHMLGCVRVKRGDDRQAIRVFHKALSYDQHNPDTWFNIGTCHFRLGEYTDAIRHFFQAVLLDEEDWEAMLSLSQCYQQIGERENGLYWRIWVYEKTRHPHVMEAIAHDYEEMGNPEEALLWYRKLLSHDPVNPAAYHGISWNLWALGKTTDAEMWLKKGLSLAPQNPDLLFTRLWMWMQQGEWAKAEKMMTRVPDHVKQQPDWLLIRSQLLTHLHEFSRAESLAEVVMQQSVPSVQAMGCFQKGRILLEQGRTAEAIRLFQQAQQLCVQWKEPVFFEGLCHFIEGRPDLTRQRWQHLST